eukprot:scaffold2214_cov139-Cylindrotheca_fusiformis.AAC.38
MAVVVWCVMAWDTQQNGGISDKGRLSVAHMRAVGSSVRQTGVDTASNWTVVVNTISTKVVSQHATFVCWIESQPQLLISSASTSEDLWSGLARTGKVRWHSCTTGWRLLEARKVDALKVLAMLRPLMENRTDKRWIWVVRTQLMTET